MATAYKDVGGYEREDGGDRQRRLLEASRPIIGRLSRLAQEQVNAKLLLEQRWLEDLQNYFARYDETTEKSLKDEQRSRAFVGLTRHKTNSWAARIGDILFPTDDKNWGIEPTPVPKLAKQAQEAVQQAMAAVDAANASADPAQQERIKEMADSFAQDARMARAGIEEAKKRCKAMEEAIEDQLVESDYVAQCRDVIEDGCKLGTGILKGPITSQKLRQQWREEDGIWGLASIPDPMPEFRRVDPWHFFPDMQSQRMSECEFTFERHLPTAKDLKRMARKLGFNRDAVGRVLKEGPRPLSTEVDHLAKLRTITGDTDVVSNRFVMWEYHGSLECEEVAMLLRAIGQEEKADRFEDEKDPLEDYRVILHFCNDEVLKIAPEYPLDSGESLYSVWNFEKGETNVFGVGVPHIMKDSQAAINAAWRMMLDNAALSVGPQVVVNRTLVTPQDGSYSLRALKVWLMSSTSGMGPQQQLPFQVFTIPINTAQIQQIIELARLFIDEETGMPQIAQGEQGAATKTLGGMSMLFNSANVVFRRIVKAWDDDLTKPTIRRAYDWNMQFNPDDSIKGDMQVDARGTSVLLVREIQSQSLMQIMTNWTTHPVLGPWFAAKPGNVRDGLVKTFQTMMLDPADMIATLDEYNEYQRQQAEAAAQEGGEMTPEAARIQVAQMDIEWQKEKLAREEAMAERKNEIEMAKLQESSGLSREELARKYDIETKKIGSAERMKAVDVAVEDKRAREAVKEGRTKTEARGKEIG